MTAFDALKEMDPAARAVAEVRAREAGMSLSRWLELLVYEHGVPTPVRHYGLYGGGLERARASGSRALATYVSSENDLNPGKYVPAPKFREFVGDLSRSIPEADDSTWSALVMITAFPSRIDHAAILLSAAFAEADVKDFRLPPIRRADRYKASGRWYRTVIDDCVHRSREVSNALTHSWSPSGRAERLWDDAFIVLCELTPARHELLVLYSHDRGRASLELAKHIDVATRQFELSASLVAQVEALAPTELSDEQRFARLRADLLARAGGGVSLTRGAELLGITRQALHKRIKMGSALGMMDGDELVLPRLQWIESGGKTAFVRGLSEIVKLFDRAGGWSALQFLVDPDPNLAQPPIEALRARRIDEAISAARAFLGLNER
jgi:hypothetical protein